VYTLLRSFGPEGLTGYDDPVYETLLAQAAAAGSSEVRCQLLAQAERQLLAGCAAVPLFAQHKRLLLAGGVEGLVFDPYGPVLDLTCTTKQYPKSPPCQNIALQHFFRGFSRPARRVFSAGTLVRSANFHTSITKPV